MRVRLKDACASGSTTPLEAGKWYEAEGPAGDPRSYEVRIQGGRVQVLAEHVESDLFPMMLGKI